MKAAFSRLAAGIALGVLLSVPVAARAADPSAGIKTYNLQTFYYIYRDGGGGIEGTMTLNVAQDGVVKGIYRTDYGRGNFTTVTGILDGHDRIVMDIGNGLQPKLHLAGYFDQDGKLHVTRQEGFTTWILSGQPQLANGEQRPVHYEP